MTTILIVEDEPALSNILRSYFEREGYSVITAARGDTAYDLILTKPIDIVLLDLNLPGMDGIDVAREVLKEKDIPIIMVTARVEEVDKLKGLEIGADDYISKPFSPREVVARVKTVLRRVEKQNPQKQKYIFKDITVDKEFRNVTIGYTPIGLTRSEFDLLVNFLQNPGRVFTRLQLLDVIQGQTYAGYERTIDAHIKNLRAKIEKDAKNPIFIKTVYGVGYRFARDDE